MSALQIAAMQRGRRQARAINDYLELIAKAGTRTDPQQVQQDIRRRLAVIERTLPWADSLTTLRLVQERRDLTRELQALDRRGGLIALDRAFVRVAADYSVRHDVTYERWRALGVPTSVLKRAGIPSSNDHLR